MDVADGATYHVERTGPTGSDLAVVFEPAQKSSTVLLTARHQARRRSSRSLTFRSSRRLRTPRQSRRRRLRLTRHRLRQWLRSDDRAPAAAPPAVAKTPPPAPRQLRCASSLCPQRRRRLRHRCWPPQTARATKSADHQRDRGEAVQGHADHARLFRRRPAIGSPLLQRDQWAQHHHRSIRSGDADRRRASRCSVGSGVRNAAEDAQAGIRGRRHDRANRAALGARGRGR